MSADNKALVRRFYEEIDKGNLDALDELVAADYLDHNLPPGSKTVAAEILGTDGQHKKTQ